MFAQTLTVYLLTKEIIMAVNDKDNEQNHTGNAGNTNSMGAAFNDARNRADTRNDSKQTAQRGGGFSFRNPGANQRLAMGRTQASEQLTKLRKAMELTATENLDDSFDWKLIDIDKTTTANLTISVLLVCVRDLTAPDLGVAFHTLLLEATADPVQPRFVNISNQQIEILSTASDAANNVLRDVCYETVKRSYPQMPIIEAGDCVVPSTFKIDDEGLMFSLTENAVFACSSKLQTARSDFRDLNLADAERDSSLVVRQTFGNPNTFDVVGSPVRGDIQLELTATGVNQNNNQGQTERTTPIASAAMFIDLIYDPAVQPQPVGFGNWGNQQGPKNYQRYAARAVITALESAFSSTTTAQLLALISASSLREGNGWINQFRPAQFAAEGVDIHDIGAVGIECNFTDNPSGFGTRIDASKPEERAAMIGLAFKQGLVLSLDVSESGPDTFYNGVFAAAAEGDPKANAKIIAAADCLTNGGFSRYFTGGRVAIDEFNRIHTGYYTNKRGERADIREIDYLAVINLVGDKDPGVIREWSDTFNRVDYPLEMRLAARKHIITNLVSNAVFTGFARRVTFEAAFIDALLKGVQEVGLQIRSVTPYNDLGVQQRANYTAGGTMLAPDMSGIFNRGNSFGPSAHSMGANRTFGGGRSW